MSAEIYAEVAYLAELAKHRDLDWSQVSGPCLRYLLGCERMQRVLDKTATLGSDSPISTATEFARAEDAKAAPHDQARAEHAALVDRVARLEKDLRYVRGCFNARGAPIAGLSSADIAAIDSALSTVKAGDESGKAGGS